MVDFFRKFQRLESLQAQRLESAGRNTAYSCDEARGRDAYARNRYRDIVPFDKNRVKLSLTPMQDYINASHIQCHGRNWIATQGPLDNTIIDFWDMAMSVEARSIIMLCSVEEFGRPKCAQYWPLAVEQHLMVADPDTGRSAKITCLTLNEDQASTATIRNLRIVFDRHGEQSTKTISHIHFAAWPDHDIAAINSLHALITLVKQPSQMAESESASGPPIVHCSAGCGRTGTFIALEALSRDATLDIDELVDDLRKQRIASVQALGQYELLYEFLAKE